MILYKVVSYLLLLRQFCFHIWMFMWIKNDIQWSYPCGGDVSPNYEDNSESSETVNKFSDLFVYLPNHVDELTVSPQQKELRFILTFHDFFPTPPCIIKMEISRWWNLRNMICRLSSSTTVFPLSRLFKKRMRRNILANRKNYPLLFGSFLCHFTIFPSAWRIWL